MLKNFINLIAAGSEFNFNAGRELIVNYKSQGGTQRAAYNALLALDNIYKKLHKDDICDIIEDVLDCICGWVGNKTSRIWDEYLSGDQ
jgi:hypothetical protein